MWKSTEYRIWAKIKQRCDNPKDPSWHNYGGRGIAVCERWQKSFKLFFKDVGLRPSSEYSLDRWPDNDGDYKPSNVRWATRVEQRANTRATVWERITLLLSGKEAPLVREMVLSHRLDKEVAQYIARVFKPKDVREDLR